MNFLRKYLIRDGRVRLPDRIWLVAIIVFLVFALSEPSRMLTITGVIPLAFAAFVTTRIKHSPALSTAGYIGIVVLATQVPLLFNIAVILWAIVFISIAANSGHAKLACACALIVLYVSSVSWVDKEFIPTDIGATLASGLFFFGAILIGLALHKERVKQEALVEQMRERREVLTRALHDSVAAKLSSVILRSETLGMSEDLEPNIRATLALIAEETRLAIGDVRQLLEAIKTNDEFAPPTAHETLDEQITESINLMESHKLRTVWNNQLTPDLAGTVTPDGFSNVLSELTMNTIKYSPAESIVQIATFLEGDFLFTEITNVVSNQQAPHYLTTSLGLSGITEWAEQNGAQCHWEQHEDIWSARVGFAT